MSMHRPRRSGLILCAIALLLAGCTSTGGAGPSPSASSTATGGHGGKHHTKGGKHGKPTKRHHHKGGSPTSSTAPSTRPTHSGAPGSGHASTSPAPHQSSRPGGGSHTSGAPHPPPRGPVVTVTPHNGLRDGQSVTVEGSGFTPNTTLVIAQCRDRGQNTNQADCNVHINLISGSYGAAKKVKSDANGHVGPVQLVVAKTFKHINCGTMKCLVAVSEPTLHPNPADEGDQYIHFA